MRAWASIATLFLINVSSDALFAEGEYVLSAGQAEGFVGDHVTVSFFLSVEGDAVEGYQWSACNDPAITIADVGFGDATAEIDFEFHAIDLFEGGWTVSAQLPAEHTLAGVEQNLYNAAYQVKGQTDLAFIEFCDTLGDPPISTRVIVGGAEIEPLTNPGRVHVLGQERGEYLFSAGKADGTVGSAVTLPFLVSIAGPAPNGYQWGACHDSNLSLTEVGLGEAAQTLDFQFHALELVDGGWTVMALLSENQSLEGVELHLYNAIYQIENEFDIAFIEFCETLGDPPVTNRVVVDRKEIVPATEPGRVHVGLGGEPVLLSLSHGEGPVGGEATSLVALTHLGSVSGYQFGVCHGERVAISDGDVTPGAALADVEFTFHVINFLDHAWNVGAVLDFQGGHVLSPGEGQELYRATYNLLEPGAALLEFCTEGLNPEANVLVVDGEDIEPATEGAVIEIHDGNFGFSRGDVDGDGMTFALLDGIFLLEFGFVDGEHPPCMDAADVNDDGTLDPLGDTLFLLMWNFIGSEPPPEPGPEGCGGDPTEDELDCQEPRECPDL